jgi:hypothetical protein
MSPIVVKKINNKIDKFMIHNLKFIYSSSSFSSSQFIGPLNINYYHIVIYYYHSNSYLISIAYFKNKNIK